jgi:hypothetical protein
MISGSEQSMSGKRKKWFCDRGGVRKGPFGNREIRELVRTGEVLPTDLLWKEGMGRWVPAGSFPKLFKVIRTRRSTGPSGRLMIAAGLLAFVAIISSPFSDFTRNFTGTPYKLLAVCSGGCFVGAITTLIISLVRGEQEVVTVPTQGRLVRVSDGNKAIFDEVEESENGLGGRVVVRAGESRGGEYGTRATSTCSESDHTLAGRTHSLGRQVLLVAVGLGLLAGATLTVVSVRWKRERGHGLRPALRTFYLSGLVVGEDEKPMLGRSILLKFSAMDSASTSPASSPTPGSALVNSRTGVFRAVMAVPKSQRLSKIRVSVLTLDEKPLPVDVLPLVYSDLTTTPLAVDVSSDDIRIKLPLR